MTWSIVARDPGTGAFGVAVTTKFFVVVLSFNLLGDGLRDALDPKHR